MALPFSARFSRSLIKHFIQQLSKRNLADGRIQIMKGASFFYISLHVGLLIRGDNIG